MPPPPAPPGATPAELRHALIEHSRSVAQLDGGRLTGPAADALRRLAVAAQHVLIGEQHGNQGIADFATAWWADLAATGYRYAALESDPWVTQALERELRAGGVPAWARFTATRGGAMAAPFYTWAPEARWVDAVLRSQPAGPVPVLWGLDQVFISSAPWLLREMAEALGASPAVAPVAAQRAADLARDAATAPQWLGRVDPARLQALAASLDPQTQAHWRALADALVESRRIYGPFSGGDGEPWIANTEREALMRRLFVAHHALAEAVDGKPPKVMFKLGGNHLFRGASSLMVQGLGGFVAEFAATRGQAVLSVLALCGPASSAGSYQGDPKRCDSLLTDGDWRFLAPYVDSRERAVTLFDLRSWRLRQRRLEGLPAEVLRVVASYDLLVFAPSSAGSRFLTAELP